MRGALLPASGASFSRKKERILELLGVPDAEYSDASPKGSVDGGIRDLIDEINALDGFVTTSSCAGRVSVFVEGRKAAGEGGDEEGPAGGGVDGAEVGEKEEARSKPATIAAVGGKGGGGAWLFVSHDPVPIVKEKEARGLLGLTNPEPTQGAIKTEMTVPRDSRLIHFKFEPMILHVLTASPEHAQLLLRCGLQAGFRESGAVNLLAATPTEAAATPIVAIRSMGLSFESLIGVREDERTKCTVSDDYLRGLLRIANERFEENRKRIDRFRTAVLEATAMKRDGGAEWEDASARRERKRAEGLQRKAELLQGRGEDTGKDEEDVILDFPANTDFT